MSLHGCTQLIPHSLPREKFFTHSFHPPDQHPSAAASDLVSFGGSDDGEMDQQPVIGGFRCGGAVGLVPLPRPLAFCIAIPVQAWTLIFSVCCLILWRSWDWNGLPQRNRPVAALYEMALSRVPRGPSSMSFAIHPRGSRRDHQIMACTLLILPTCLFFLRPHFSQRRGTKKDTTTCLTWMSQWPRISAHPQTLAGRQKPLMADPWHS